MWYNKLIEVYNFLITEIYTLNVFVILLKKSKFIFLYAVFYDPFYLKKRFLYTKFIIEMNVQISVT